jgi:hypothetical protein
MKPISKNLYIGSIIGALSGATLLNIFSMALMGSRDSAMVGIRAFFSLVALGLIVWAVVMIAMLVYKLWTALQNKGARTTPGKAVGFLFIPFFNFYWIFQAYWGWTKDFNKYISSNNINTPPMPEAIALTLCILTVVSIIPFVGIVVGIVNIVLMAILFSKAIDGVNTINAQNA